MTTRETFSLDVQAVDAELQKPQTNSERWAEFLRLLAEGLEEGWIMPSQAVALIANVYRPQPKAG